MRLGARGDGSHLAAEHAGEASVLRDLHLLDLLTHGRTVARTVLACDPDLLGVLAHLGAGFLTAKRVAARRLREAAEPGDDRSSKGRENDSGQYIRMASFWYPHFPFLEGQRICPAF